MVGARSLVDDRLVWNLWMMIGPLLPVALALAVLRTVPGRVMTAALVGVGQGVAFAASAANDDPTALGFAIVLLPIYAVGAVVGAGVVERIVVAQLRAAAPGPASFGDRVAAVIVDAASVGLVGWRVAESWDGPWEVAGPIALGVGYLTAGAACAGTIGHRALGLRVYRAGVDRALRADRALARGVLVFVEVVAALTCVGAFVALADLARLAEPGGRSFADRVVRSRVVRVGRHPEPG
jgi:hypothetical protein